MRIILASQSPRRRELLERVGIKDFAVAAPNVDESVEPGLAPAEMVERLSLRKAGAAAEKAEPEALIIAADTVVALDGAVLDPGPGLTVITAPNEGGKSTWAGFWKAMLYGIDTRERDKSGFLADKTRYLPWSGAPMAG